MKRSLIIGIILIIVCISLTVYKDFINKPVNINNITNTGLKEENRKVYLDATFVAGTIVLNDDNSFYVMFGDGVQYIVYLSNKEANKINNYLLDNPNDSYHIEGVTKLIPRSLEENGKKFVKEWLDTNHNHDGSEEESHTHNITSEEFYHYFGYVYLDNTYNLSLITIIIYITGITGVLFITNYGNTKYHFL